MGGCRAKYLGNSVGEGMCRLNAAECIQILPILSLQVGVRGENFIWAVDERGEVTYES